VGLAEVVVAGTAEVWASVGPIGEDLLRVVDWARGWGEAIPIPTAGSTPGSLAVGGRWVLGPMVLPLTSGPSVALQRGPDLRTTSEQAYLQ
jgi:hypothetical protein